MKTVSLELAKQLEEAGYDGGHEFYFAEYGSRGDFTRVDYVELANDLNEHTAIPAPTADEILDQLPATFLEVTTYLPLTIEVNASVSESGRSVCIRYGSPQSVVNRPHICGNESLADAAAKMWLYLKKEGLLKNE
jgi:hypothetical protein